MTGLPTLVVVSGPAGAGKTTLAHRLGAAVGCPVISRDEIKEGMVHASPGFVPAVGDELTMRTLDSLLSYDATQRAGHDAFDRVSISAPFMEVDMSDGYRPGLDEILAFVNG